MVSEGGKRALSRQPRRQACSEAKCGNVMKERSQFMRCMVMEYPLGRNLRWTCKHDVITM